MTGRGCCSYREAPRYLIRDRDCVYGNEVRRRLESVGIEKVVLAAVAVTPPSILGRSSLPSHCAILSGNRG